MPNRSSPYPASHCRPIDTSCQCCRVSRSTHRQCSSLRAIVVWSTLGKCRSDVKSRVQEYLGSVGRDSCTLQKGANVGSGGITQAQPHLMHRRPAVVGWEPNLVGQPSISVSRSPSAFFTYTRRSRHDIISSGQTQGVAISVDEGSSHRSATDPAQCISVSRRVPR